MEFVELNEEQNTALNQGLKLASRIAGKEGSLSVDGVNALYKSFIDENIQEPNAQIALGLAFGQLFVERGQFEWIRIRDEYGEETALALKNIKIMTAPISMIQKRLNEQIDVNIDSLVNDTIEAVEELIESGNYETR